MMFLLFCQPQECLSRKHKLVKRLSSTRVIDEQTSDCCVDITGILLVHFKRKEGRKRSKIFSSSASEIGLFVSAVLEHHFKIPRTETKLFLHWRTVDI